MMANYKWYVRQLVDHGFVYQMEHAGYKAKLMRAPRLTGDCTHSLPPGEPIPVFPLACVPGAPKEWVREAGSYVVPVDVDWALWFDWTMNDGYNTAVMPSVKGMNPITGRKLESLQLEQYADKCPIHNEPFAHARFCQKCGYEWPPQGYVTHESTLWWDGFANPSDGTVRQFYFTDEDKKDIASLVIGKENTVPAFGFAFYKPKVSRTPPQRSITRGGGYWNVKCGSAGVQTKSIKMKHYGGISGQSVNTCDSYDENELIGCSMENSVLSESPQVLFAAAVDFSATETKCITGPQGSIGTKGPMGPIGNQARSVLRCKAAKSKSVGVGAGAKINQHLVQDSLGVDGWKPEPAAVIRLYFTFEEQFSSMVKNGGIIDLKSQPEGYLKGLPVG